MRIRRRSVTTAAAVLVASLATAACSISPELPSALGTGEPVVAPPSPTPTLAELPGGGRQLFPTYRLVGYSGVIGSGAALGRAGVGDVDERMQEMIQRAQPYAADGRRIMPTLEYIATVVKKCREATKCRTRASDEQVQKHLDAVRKVNGMLLLAIQPGRSDFPTEVKAYERFLKEPDVGVALDPEWRMGPNQEPMQTFGSTSADELNETSAYLDQLVRENNLPQKVMLYHMIRTNWVRNPKQLKPRDNLAMIVSVDGIGSKAMKVETWNAIMTVKPPFVHTGFKMFYQEDTARPSWRLMTPSEVLALVPKPEYVLYE